MEAHLHQQRSISFVRLRAYSYRQACPPAHNCTALLSTLKRYMLILQAYREKFPAGRRVSMGNCRMCAKVHALTDSFGMTGQSSTRGTCVTPKECHTTTSSFLIWRSCKNERGTHQTLYTAAVPQASHQMRHHHPLIASSITTSRLLLFLGTVCKALKAIIADTYKSLSKARPYRSASTRGQLTRLVQASMPAMSPPSGYFPAGHRSSSE